MFFGLESRFFVKVFYFFVGILFIFDSNLFYWMILLKRFYDFCGVCGFIEIVYLIVSKFWFG